MGRVTGSSPKLGIGIVLGTLYSLFYFSEFTNVHFPSQYGSQGETQIRIMEVELEELPDALP